MRHPSFVIGAVTLLCATALFAQTFGTKQRPPKPDEFGTVAEYLARRDVTFHTGDEIVVDGGYTKKPFLKRVLQLSGVVVVGRLRKDAALRDLPPKKSKRATP